MNIKAVAIEIGALVAIPPLVLFLSILAILTAKGIIKPLTMFWLSTVMILVYVGVLLLLTWRLVSVAKHSLIQPITTNLSLVGDVAETAGKWAFDQARQRLF